jgi:hypothetical protein
VTTMQILNIVFALAIIASIVGMLAWSIRSDKLDRLA